MIQIFTDGSCKGNGQKENIGGNGYLILINKQLYTHKTEVNKNTTNNREELKAVINALNYITFSNQENPIYIYSDSQYVVKGLTFWSKKWEANNWKTGKNSTKEIKNSDLWVELHALYRQIKPSIQWVKGHTTNKSDWNNTIDRLINEAINFS